MASGPLYGGHYNTDARFNWTNHDGTNAGDGNTEIFSGGFYGSFVYKGLVVDGNLSGAYNRHKRKRDLNFEGRKFSPTQSYTSASGLADVKIGYQFNFPKNMLQPYIRAGYLLEKEHDYRESNGQGLDMRFDEQTFQMARYEGGVLGNTFFGSSTNLSAVTYKLSYVHKMPTEKAQVVMAGFHYVPGRYASRALPMARNFANIGIGLVGGGEHSGVSFNYNAEFSGSDLKHDFIVKATRRW